jgi:hypothetical protein
MTRWLGLAVLGACIVLVLVGAYLGWYGPLVTCGADAAPLCVHWPGPASAAVWLAFLAFVLLLAAWQVAHWRDDAAD